MRGVAGRLVIVAILIGPTAAAYLLIPAGALAAWPALALWLSPGIAALLAGLALHTWRPGLEAPLATTAAGWLKAEIARLGRVGLGVAAMERAQDRISFYHPASTTIVLAEDVFAAHDVRAHATAAHELGHALLHLDRPSLSRVLMGARRYASSVFQAGAGLLVGATLVGGGAVRVLAIALLAAAMVLQALVLVDEAAASATARRLLAAHLDGEGQADAAAADLRRALATYVLSLAATIAAVVAAAWLAGQHGDGVLVRDDNLGAHAATAVTIVAGVVLASAVATLALAVWPTRGALETTGVMLGLLAMLWCPLLVVLLCDVGDAPAWAVACAVVPACGILAAPPVWIVQRLAQALGRDVAAASSPLPGGGARPSIHRVGAAGLGGYEEPDGLIARVVGSIGMLWPLPLAAWWLF